MKVCFLDNNIIPYSSKDINSNRIRGAENILINLAKEISNQGNDVTVFNNYVGNDIIDNVRWLNLSQTHNDNFYDVAITNNDMRLFDKVRSNKYFAFSHSIQSIEKFIRKKQLISYLKYKPKIVLLSDYHKQNRNFFLKMFGSFRLDWAVDNEFLDINLNDDIIENIAIFTSRSDRNLDLLVNIWKNNIFPNNNHLKLLITPNKLTRVDSGIYERNFGDKHSLINDLLKSKVFLVPGHKAELFCIAAEEARELCIPIVTLGKGALSERVEHEKTGFIAKNNEEFAYFTLKLFNDKDVWQKLRRNLIRLRGSKTWKAVALKLIKNF